MPPKALISTGTKTFSKKSGATSSDEAEYDRLRSLAHAAHAKRNDCYERSRAAYTSGNGALAKQLSNEGKEHDRVGDDLHRQARDFIFRANNAGRAGDEIDLHGLYVQEAEEVLRIRLEAEMGRGNPGGIHVIVGKGNHSDGGVQKIKPAVESLCRNMGLQYSTEQNAGRMYIALSPTGQAGEVPTSNHPYKPSKTGNGAYGGSNTQASGAGYPGQQQQQQQSSHGYGGGSNSHQQQPQQQQQQAGQPTNELEELAKKEGKKFIKKLAGCCIVM
ncbi:hypothetical protein DFH27DRAFT_612151 [Peziza echinospora]|nr:hypothetical protein DFH27DRAFT_612151 [Peziza echinospora]